MTSPLFCWTRLEGNEVRGRQGTRGGGPGTGAPKPLRRVEATVPEPGRVLPTDGSAGSRYRLKATGFRHACLHQPSAVAAASAPPDRRKLNWPAASSL